jgi:hypothetical protein
MDLSGCSLSGHCGSGVFNVHVSAKRGASVDVMLEAACMLRDHLFKTGAQVLHGWVARFNRGVIRLGEHAGFHRDGVRMFKGECRGRVIEVGAFGFYQSRLGGRN